MAKIWLSNVKAITQRFIPLINRYWFLELILNNLGLVIVGTISIIPAVYFGSPDWLKTTFIWMSSTVVIFSLLRIILVFLAKKYFVIEAKQSSKISIGFILQRFTSITVTLFIMVFSGIIGTRCFGQKLVTQSCLACQVVTGNYKSAVWLIMVGVDLNKPDDFGQSPLIHAVSRQQEWLAKLLVFSGAEVEFTDKPILTSPLIVAVHKGNFELAKLLLEHKANPNKTIINVSPLHIALKKKRFDIAKLLLEHGADLNGKNALGMNALLYESKAGSINAINFLIDNKVDINVSNDNNETPLYLAVVGGKTEVVTILLKNGANVDGNALSDLTKTTTNSETPLMAAIRLNHIEIKQALVEQGAKAK